MTTTSARKSLPHSPPSARKSLEKKTSLNVMQNIPEASSLPRKPPTSSQIHPAMNLHGTAASLADFRDMLAYLYTAEPHSHRTGSLLSADALPCDNDIDRLNADLLALWKNRQWTDLTLYVSDGTTGSANQTAPTAIKPSSFSNPLASPSLCSSSSSMLLLPPMADAEEEESQGSFAAHKFILVSRSPYFAAQFLSSAGYSDSNTSSIHLPSGPPFTPTALYFTLGFLYTGTLNFSQRSFDLTIAFEIWRVAAYLQVRSLTDLASSIIAHDFCHSFRCTHIAGACQTCCKRVPRTLAFAASPDVGDIVLYHLALTALTTGEFACMWDREVGSMDVSLRSEIVRAVCNNMQKDDKEEHAGPANCLSILRQVMLLTTRLDSTRTVKWVDNLRAMVEEITTSVQTQLILHFDGIVLSSGFSDLIEGVGMHYDVIERLFSLLLAALPTHSHLAPQIYQSLVGNILLRGEEGLARGTIRDKVEETRSELIKFLSKRWVNVRAAAAFNSLEKWALKEIADEIDVAWSELLLPDEEVKREKEKKQASTSTAPTPAAKRTSTLQAARNEGERPAGPINLRAAVLNRNAARIGASSGNRTNGTPSSSSPATTTPVSRSTTATSTATRSTPGPSTLRPASASRTLPTTPASRASASSPTQRLTNATTSRNAPSNSTSATATSATAAPRVLRPSPSNSQLRPSQSAITSDPIATTARRKPVTRPPAPSVTRGESPHPQSETPLQIHTNNTTNTVRQEEQSAVDGEEASKNVALPSESSKIDQSVPKTGEQSSSTSSNGPEPTSSSPEMLQPALPPTLLPASSPVSTTAEPLASQNRTSRHALGSKVAGLAARFSGGGSPPAPSAPVRRLSSIEGKRLAPSTQPTPPPPTSASRTSSSTDAPYSSAAAFAARRRRISLTPRPRTPATSATKTSIINNGSASGSASSASSRNTSPTRPKSTLSPSLSTHPVYAAARRKSSSPSAAQQFPTRSASVVSLAERRATVRRNAAGGSVSKKEIQSDPQSSKSTTDGDEAESGGDAVASEQALQGEAENLDHVAETRQLPDSTQSSDAAEPLPKEAGANTIGSEEAAATAVEQTQPTSEAAETTKDEQCGLMSETASDLLQKETAVAETTPEVEPAIEAESSTHHPSASDEKVPAEGSVDEDATPKAVPDGESPAATSAGEEGMTREEKSAVASAEEELAAEEVSIIDKPTETAQAPLANAESGQTVSASNEVAQPVEGKDLVSGQTESSSQTRDEVPTVSAADDQTQSSIPEDAAAQLADEQQAEVQAEDESSTKDERGAPDETSPDAMEAQIEDQTLSDTAGDSQGDSTTSIQDNSYASSENGSIDGTTDTLDTTQDPHSVTEAFRRDAPEDGPAREPFPSSLIESAPGPHTPRAIRTMGLPMEMDITPRPSKFISDADASATVTAKKMRSARIDSGQFSVVPPATTLSVGIPCIIWPTLPGLPPRTRMRAMVKYIGPVEGFEGAMVGVEVPLPLAEAVQPCQDQFNDGSIHGKRYFHLGPSWSSRSVSMTASGASTPASGCGSPPSLSMMQVGGASRLSVHLDMFARAEREARKRRIARLHANASRVVSAPAGEHQGGDGANGNGHANMATIRGPRHSGPAGHLSSRGLFTSAPTSPSEEDGLRWGGETSSLYSLGARGNTSLSTLTGSVESDHDGDGEGSVFGMRFSSRAPSLHSKRKISGSGSRRSSTLMRTPSMLSLASLHEQEDGDAHKKSHQLTSANLRSLDGDDGRHGSGSRSPSPSLVLHPFRDDNDDDAVGTDDDDSRRHQSRPTPPPPPPPSAFPGSSLHPFALSSRSRRSSWSPSVAGSVRSASTIGTAKRPGTSRYGGGGSSASFMERMEEESTPRLGLFVRPDEVVWVFEDE